MDFRSRRMHGPQWLSGAVHFSILLIAVHSDTAAAWPFALLAMSGVSFLAWAANYRRYRQIHDLPTSKVASAAQGYVELFGHGERLPGDPLLSPLSRRPCCWYAFEVRERGADGKWRFVERGKSVEHFLLIDETGQCVVSPEGAEVLSGFHRSWQSDDRRYTEDLILPGAPLYAVGEFTTVAGGVACAREERSEVSALLSEWKLDRQRLHERFDVNRDGDLDLAEWECARLAAIEEVRERHRQHAARSAEGVHLLRKPGDGRLYLIASELPDALGARFRYWSWAHLVLFVSAGSTGFSML